MFSVSVKYIFKILIEFAYERLVQPGTLSLIKQQCVKKLNLSFAIETSFDERIEFRIANSQGIVGNLQIAIMKCKQMTD